MVESGLLDRDADPYALSMGVFGALHGGLSLMVTLESVDPLRAALDTCLATLHAAAQGSAARPAA
jgi:hypothetical protein